MKYIIGDLQGCFDALQSLLKNLNYDESKDELYFVGDLVNRGPKSLECLHFVKSLGKPAHTVLGNHDLYFLATCFGTEKKDHDDTMDPVRNAPDRDELIEWLLQQPMAVYFQQENTLMTHAGVYPSWSVEKTLQLSKEVETALQSDAETYFKNMYGNTPTIWRDDLAGWDRLRLITNIFTRMRYLDDSLALDFKHKRKPGTQPNSLKPWFDFDRESDCRVVFGHWADLNGLTGHADIIGVDTGCVWGRSLSAFALG